MGMELHFKKGIKGIGAHTASGNFFVDGGVEKKSQKFDFPCYVLS